MGLVELELGRVSKGMVRVSRVSIGVKVLELGLGLWFELGGMSDSQGK